MVNWSAVRHFRPHEFDSPDKPGSGERMDPGLIAKLDLIRERCGFPFVVNSGYRTAGYNAQVGGVDGSAHEDGKAVDIAARTSRERYRIVQEALASGVRRVGIGKTFVHLDVDESKPGEVIWLYS